MTRHSHPALAQVRQLGLISENELDDAIAELEILALDEEDDVDMPRLAADATAADALAWLTDQSSKDTKSGADTNVRHMADPTSAVNINMGTLVGSYASVAKMLDEIDTVPGAEGILLTFDDFVEGIENFGRYIQPLMKTRQHIAAEQKEVA